MKIEPYLFFEGRCEEAIEFYKTPLGAEVVMLMRFKDSPETGDSGTCRGDRRTRSCMRPCASAKRR